MPTRERATAMPSVSSLASVLSPLHGGGPPTAGRATLRGLLVAAAAVAAAILVGRLVGGIAHLPNLAMIFIPAILYTALKHGFPSALFASAFSLLAYNFFFMEPFGAFGVRGIDDVLAIAVFLAVGAITSDLANQVRRQAAAAHEREAHTAALYELKRAIDRTDSSDRLARTVIEQLGRRFDMAVALWEHEPKNGAWRLLAASDSAITSTPPQSAGAVPPPRRVDSTLHIPMMVGESSVGMIVVSPAERANRSSSMAVMQALANEVGDALRHVHMAQELQAARRRAEAERLRVALLNSITHDFRTPLSSILGATTTLMVPGSSFTAEARAMLLATIREEALRLDRFIRNLLDMSRLEAGAVVPNLDWVDVVDIVGTATQHIRRGLGDVALEIVLPDSLPMLRLDAVLTEHALVNLLDNAIKHSPPRGRIRIGARQTGAAVILEVDDEGPGVPAAERELIFEKFGKARSGDRGRAGTGLGLSIARGFIEAQGGRVRVTDGPRGARLHMELPLSPPAVVSPKPGVL